MSDEVGHIAFILSKMLGLGSMDGLWECDYDITDQLREFITNTARKRKVEQTTINQ